MLVALTFAFRVEAAVIPVLSTVSEPKPCASSYSVVPVELKKRSVAAAQQVAMPVEVLARATPLS